MCEISFKVNTCIWRAPLPLDWWDFTHQMWNHASQMLYGPYSLHQTTIKKLNRSKPKDFYKKYRSRTTWCLFMHKECFNKTIQGNIGFSNENDEHYTVTFGVGFHEMTFPLLNRLSIGLLTTFSLEHRKYARRNKNDWKSTQIRALRKLWTPTSIFCF